MSERPQPRAPPETVYLPAITPETARRLRERLVGHLGGVAPAPPWEG